MQDADGNRINYGFGGANVEFALPDGRHRVVSIVDPPPDLLEPFGYAASSPSRCPGGIDPGATALE